MSKTALYEKTEATEIAKYDGCKKAAETMKTRLPITHLGKAARKRALSEGRLMTAKQAAQAATITKVAGITEADDKRREQRKADLEQADKDIAAEQVRLEKEAEERELAELKRVEEAERAEAEHLRRVEAEEAQAAKEHAEQEAASQVIEDELLEAEVVEEIATDTVLTEKLADDAPLQVVPDEELARVTTPSQTDVAVEDDLEEAVDLLD